MSINKNTPTDKSTSTAWNTLAGTPSAQNVESKAKMSKKTTHSVAYEDGTFELTVETEGGGEAGLFYCH
jgi:hypothetical protein